MNFVCSEVENMSISVHYYEFIRQMYETLTKYIKGYKSETNDYYKKISKLHEKYFPKLSAMKEELKKMTNIKTNHIISLSSKVPKIISQQITNLKYFVAGIETTVKSFDKIIKEKNSMSSKYQNEYEDCRNSLLKKYKEIEKSKNLYFSNASQTEDLIHKYYISKSPHQKENHDLTETPPLITDAQIENSIKQTKKNENDYLNLVKSAKAYEEKFFELSDTSKDNMKRISCEIITKMKDNIVDFLLLLKNCFKLPLSEIDTYLPELIKLDENKKIEHIINSTYKKDHSLIPISTEKYNIKLIQQQMENPNEEENDNNIIMIEEDEILNTIKKMEDNFDLIEKNSLEHINNQMKLRCRELTFKLLSFSPKIIEVIKEYNIVKDKNLENEKENEKDNENKDNENEINNDNNNEIKNDEKNKYSITQEEVEELSKLIEDKGNRFIFLIKINTFRKYGDFAIPEREFNIICDLFNKIADFIKKENDFGAIKSIIILSQTYFKLENDQKIYIQQQLKKNILFKDKEFWEEFVNTSILKEVQKQLNNDIKDLTIVDSHKTMENKKYEEIIFAQLLPLIKNMIDFELEDNKIKTITQTIISYYKIKEDTAKIIYDMIENKGTDKEAKDKYGKNLDLTIVNEENEEYIENENDKTNTNKNNNGNDKKEKENEDEDNDDINNQMIVDVNHTLADDDDINNKMIKNINSDEIDDDINDQMIKDIDDDNNIENDNNEVEEKEADGEVDEKKKDEENNNKKNEE